MSAFPGSRRQILVGMLWGYWRIACIKNERYGQALDFLERARLRLEEETSERFYAAEIYRLLGEAYLRSRQDLHQAERYLSKGLKVPATRKPNPSNLNFAVSIYDLYELR